MRKHIFCACAALCVGLATVASAHRLANGNYVALSELTQRFDLGHTGGPTLEAQVNHADILLNGVRHWLNSPVIAARGRSWVSADDVEQTIRPVLQPHSATVRVIVLDPGHGGSDSGTRGAHTQEKEMTLALAKQLEPVLTADGFYVHLTHTTDRTVSLEERVEFCRSVSADLFVSLHFNAGGTAQGIETYCLTPAGVASTARVQSNVSKAEHYAGNQFNNANVWLAHCVQGAIVRDTGAADRGVRRARFQVLRDAPCPAILVEGGFLSNAAEEQQILRAEYREELARAVAEGILSYQSHNHGGSHG